MSRKFRVAYLSNFDARDKNNNSGLHYYMSNQLIKHCQHVDFYHPTGFWVHFVDRIFRKIYSIIFGSGRLYENSPLNAVVYGLYFTLIILCKKYDFIFISRGSNIVAFLFHPAPILYTSDATLHLMWDYYPFFRAMPRRAFSFFNLVEKRAISKSAVVIYPSTWAARSAIEQYKKTPDKVFVVPSGANFEKDEIPSVNEIQRHRNCPLQECHLLFVGKDWERKGGKIAFQAMKLLNAQGFQTHLTMIGCLPPDEIHSQHLEIIGFLDKNKKKDAAQFKKIFLNADFFLLPTKNETFGIVLVEACAFGLPILASDTGGISTIVEQGGNGFLFPVTATAENYADKIAELFTDSDRYRKMSEISREKFNEQFNWNAWGKAVFKIIQTITH